MLIEALDDPYFTVRRPAARALVRLGPEAHAAMTEALRTAGGRRLRELIAALGETGSRRAARELGRLMKHPDAFVRADAADAIRQAAPYASLAGLSRVNAVKPELAARFAEMEQAMRRLRAAAAEEEAAASNLTAILMPYAYRAVFWLVVSAALAAGLYGCARRACWWRAALNGLCAALFGLSAAWFGSPFGETFAWLLPAVVCGVPAALWQLLRHKSPAASRQVLAAWALAGLAPFFVTRAWF